MQVAIIDLGTNSIRLFVFSISDSKKATIIHREKRIVRLGDGVYLNKKLSNEAKKRTLKAFKAYSKIIKFYKVVETRVVATSALRTAIDADVFIQSVRRATGLNIFVISGQRESDLIAKGISSNIKLPNHPVMLIDIGGGSAELSLCLGPKVLRSTSLPLGAANCQQRFLKTVPPVKSSKTQGEVGLRNYVRKQLKSKMPLIKNQTPKYAIGSSGSIRAYARLGTIKRRRYVELSRLTKQIELLRALSRKELLSIPTIENKRTDLILSAGIVLEEIMKFYKIKKVQITDYALKDGIIAEFIDTWL